MYKFLLSLISIFIINCSIAQTTATDGDWKKQFAVLKNTIEADAMIRVGDIDNLNQGWIEGFNPFSGRSTDAHPFPWEINNSDAAGTDRIYIPTSFRYGSDSSHDGYTGSTERPFNTPTAIIIPLKDITGITVASASLQIFIDDFQSPDFNSKFLFKINGRRFVEGEKMIGKIGQGGPVGKLITLKLADEFLPFIHPDSTLKIFIDDPITGLGDGFAIDFVKLLINPKGILYKGSVKGKIIDAETKEPIANAEAAVKDFGNVKTNSDGDFELNGIPAGLTIVSGSASGYSSAQKQVDIIANETAIDVILELNRSGKVTFNNKTLQEGDNLIMNNIQFEVSSAVLLAAGKTELDKLYLFMKQNPGVEILLSGHTSSEGSATLNRELSLKRVSSCKKYLLEKGIDEGRITIKGYGPDQPITLNDTEANRAKNRRVEMKITKL